MQPSSQSQAAGKSMKSSGAMKRRNIIVLIAIALALCLIYWPTLRWLVNSWLSSPYYSHGFLVPIVSGAITWTKREQLKTRAPSLYGILWILPAALLYVLNIVLEIRLLGPLSLLILIVGLIWLFRGARAVKTLAFPLVFLLFLVPAPFIPELAYRLQEISAFSSSRLLQVLGFPITSTGAEIYLETTVFTVGIPCSGINSLVALLALAAVYTFILMGSLSRRIGLFVLAFPIAIVANILRIVSIIAVAYFINVQTAAGWYHDISSPIFFILAFLAVVLAGRLMKCKINYGLLRK
jgi:exosortase